MAAGPIHAFVCFAGAIAHERPMSMKKSCFEIARNKKTVGGESYILGSQGRENKRRQVEKPRVFNIMVV